MPLTQEEKCMAQENYEKLPDACYVLVELTNQIGIVKKGESGYYPTNLLVTEGKGQKLADYHNEEMGVTLQQANAMKWGSMFGWHTKGANPDNYDKKGRINAKAWTLDEQPQKKRHDEPER